MRVLLLISCLFAYRNILLLVIPLQNLDFFYSHLPGVSSPTLGWRHNVLLVEASQSPDSGRAIHHARSLESFCARNAIRLSCMQGLSGNVKTMPGTALPTPFASPQFTGSFPCSPHVYSPDISQRIGRIELVPPLSLDGQLGKTATSPPLSPRSIRQLSLPVRMLHEKLQNSLQVGVVHLALQNDSDGLIMRYLLLHILNFFSLVPMLFLYVDGGMILVAICLVGTMMFLWWLNLESLPRNFSKVLNSVYCQH